MINGKAIAVSLAVVIQTANPLDLQTVGFLRMTSKLRITLGID